MGGRIHEGPGGIKLGLQSAVAVLCFIDIYAFTCFIYCMVLIKVVHPDDINALSGIDIKHRTCCTVNLIRLTCALLLKELHPATVLKD